MPTPTKTEKPVDIFSYVTSVNIKYWKPKHLLFKKINVIIGVFFVFLQCVELSHMKLDDLKMQDPKDKGSNAAAEH